MQGLLDHLPDASEMSDAARAYIYREWVRSQAAHSHLNFMRWNWPTAAPMSEGEHQRIACECFDEALRLFEHEQSSYWIFVMPFRHQKSDIFSRFGPPHILGTFPDAEIIMASYNSDQAEPLSKQAREIISSPPYAQLFPDTVLDPDSKSAKLWKVLGRRGKVQALGFGGASAGKGAEFFIPDDPFKNRDEAESQTLRDKRWESFTNDFMTRLAPVHCVMLVMTRWHVDDVVGRILAAMDGDPNFPKFRLVHFRAVDDTDSGNLMTLNEHAVLPGRPPIWMNEPGRKYLFTERYSAQWYEGQRATLGEYGFASLMQGDPVLKGGNVLAVDRIEWVDESEVPDGLVQARAWDLASTEKELNKDDPDYTATARVGARYNGLGQIEYWVLDLNRGQWEAPKRNPIIVQTARDDGPEVFQSVEAVGGYKDTFAMVRDVLNGVSMVHPIYPRKDKREMCAATIEVPIASGLVKIRKGWWKPAFMTEAAQFPDGAHDDMVNALMLACMKAKERLERGGRPGSTFRGAR